MTTTPTETELATGFLSRIIAGQLGYNAVVTTEVTNGTIDFKLNINNELRTVKVTVEIVEG